ncbi:MAG TPA: methyltransferase domain-containing protein [Thermoanaerobaculia bacterium]
MLTPRRLVSAEMLDEPDAPLDDVDRSLRDLRMINHYGGGVRIYRRLVRIFSPGSILDLGTGTSDLLESVPQVRLRVGMDFKIEHLVYIRTPGIHKVVGDARRLPFRDESIDLVTSAHFLHHFSPGENVAMIDDALRATRMGVAINDTRRHYVPLIVVLLAGLFRLVGRITRFDAPASVRQGYTLDEAREIARKTRCARWQVRRAWPFRFALLLWKR